jgi:hypothetical protein
MPRLIRWLSKEYQVRNQAKVSAAGVTNDLPIVSGWNFSFALTLSTYLTCFGIDDGSSVRAMVLHVIFNQPLAFFARVGVPDGARYLVRFFVHIFNDELPFCKESSLGHACILYDAFDKTQDIVFRNFWSMTRMGAKPLQAAVDG